MRLAWRTRHGRKRLRASQQGPRASQRSLRFERLESLQFCAVTPLGTDFLGGAGAIDNSLLGDEIVAEFSSANMEGYFLTWNRTERFAAFGADGRTPCAPTAGGVSESRVVI